MVASFGWAVMQRMPAARARLKRLNYYLVENGEAVRDFIPTVQIARLVVTRPMINEVTDDQRGHRHVEASILWTVVHRWMQGSAWGKLRPCPNLNERRHRMNRSGQSVIKRRVRDQGKTRSAKPEVQATEWELADERLDEALRQTFPASDALSIIQNVRGH
jgi:hypothetical protein